ncbi:MAG: PadR family transcriptional regulator [Cyclobacteriaceae bacterium]|nr:PadR family transcriptional regulator [Cyclobacteriaceae bacterium]
MDFSKGLMAASTKPLILSVLKRGDSYGYQIIQNVKKLTGGTLKWSDGMVYPVLHRMEKEGFITSEWQGKPGEKLRKYYSITERGKQELIVEKEQWNFLHGVLSKFWEQSLT